MKGLCNAASIFSSVVPFIVVLLPLVSFNKFSCHRHDSLCNCWYMLYEHTCKLDVLLLSTIIFATILYVHETHHSIQGAEVIIVLGLFKTSLFIVWKMWMQDNGHHHFMMWTQFISYIHCGTFSMQLKSCKYGYGITGDLPWLQRSQSHNDLSPVEA